VRAALGGSEKLHVTLLFLGEASPSTWRRASPAVAGLPAPRFAVKGVVGVPRRRPRLFALDLDDVGGHGAEMHGAVCEALGVAIERPFWPHVTLLRVRRGRKPEAPVPPRVIEPFAPTALTLYESRGGRYLALHSRGLC
jgi:2'-5' RNA ligase